MTKQQKKNRTNSTSSPASNPVLRIEWPTLAIAIGCYGGFGILTYYAGSIGLWATVPLLAIVLTLHSSLQHEVLHGHPFARQWVNDLLVLPAIGLLIPYDRFRDTHLAHHFDPKLTDPYEDPESNFVDPARWRTFSRPRKTLLRFNNILAGRMIVGPIISLATLYRDDLKALAAGNRHIWRGYIQHGVGLLLVVLWVSAFSTLPVWAYVLAAYLGLSLLKIRTFLEHRAHERVAGRNVIVEDHGPLSLLFLNNNYHAVHHALPQVPWYRLPAVFTARREEFLRRNDGYWYRSYLDIFLKYLFAAKDPVPHPLRLLPGEGQTNTIEISTPRKTTSAAGY